MPTIDSLENIPGDEPLDNLLDISVGKPVYCDPTGLSEGEDEPLFFDEVRINLQRTLG